MATQYDDRSFLSRNLWDAHKSHHHFGRKSNAIHKDPVDWSWGVTPEVSPGDTLVIHHPLTLDEIVGMLYPRILPGLFRQLNTLQQRRHVFFWFNEIGLPPNELTARRESLEVIRGACSNLWRGPYYDGMPPPDWKPTRDARPVSSCVIM